MRTVRRPTGSAVPRVTRAAAAAVVVAALVSAASAAFVPHAGAAAVGDCVTDPSWGTPRADLASQMVSAVNAHRASKGLPTLGTDSALGAAAYWKAMHMAWLRYSSQDDVAPPLNRTLAQRLEACGYQTGPGTYAQVVTYYYTSASAALGAWLDQPVTRQKLENASFRGIGSAAAVSTTNGTIYWAVTLGTTTDGTPPPPPPPAPPPPGPPAPPPPPASPPPLSPTTPAAIRFTSVPADGPSQRVTFTWGTTGFGVLAACSLDGGPLVPCDSPKVYTGLSVGPHTLRVEVSNRISSSSASHSWRVTAGGSSSSPPPPPSGSTRPTPPPSAGGTQFAPLTLAGHRLAPARLRPRGRVTLTLLLDGDTRRIASDGRLTCSARAGRTRLRAVSRRITASAGGAATAACTWRLPARSRGRFFTALAEVAVGSDDVERSVARRIR